MSAAAASNAEADTQAGGAPAPVSSDHALYVLRLADTALITAQQLAALIGHAPAIEQDLGIANIALDLLGRARLLLTHAGELEGRGRSEDDLAFLREPSEFVNVSLAEQPNGDFAHTLLRQFLLDAWHRVTLEALQRSRDGRLAQIAAKSLKETRYHLRFSSGWVVRLGDGTAESHRRLEQALDRLWPFTAELFDADELDQAMVATQIAPLPAEISTRWHARVQEVLAEAGLTAPAPASFRWYGKRGQHSEHLGHVLAEMQILQRTYPGAQW